MKINIACPTTGGQKIFDIDDEKKLRIFMDKRISEEVDATPLGDAFKGYILRITGGNDKDGFPMKQGVLVNHRVRLLLAPGVVGFRRGRHEGVRRRRTVRGCIIANDLSVVNTVVVKKGDAEIEGLTDKVIPRRVGPKRASKIRKLFNLSYKDDVRKYVIGRKRPNKKEGKKEHVKTPKIQRLVTSRTLQHRRRIMATRKHRWAKTAREVAEYNQLIRSRAKAIAQKRVEVKKKTNSFAHLQKMLLLKKAIAKKRSEKYVAKVRHLNALRVANARRAEMRKTHPKVKLTPEQIKDKIEIRNKLRRKAWNKAKCELRRARHNALMVKRQQKLEVRKLAKIVATKMPKNHAARKALLKKYDAATKLANTIPKIFSKKGALDFLGKNRRPFGIKAKAHKVAEKKPAAPKTAEKKPVEKKAEKKAEKKPVDKKPAEKKAEKKPVDKKPVEKKVTAKKPVDKKPAEKKTEKKAAKKN